MTENFHVILSVAPFACQRQARGAKDLNVQIKHDSSVETPSSALSS
jgi:hypothetical protein